MHADYMLIEGATFHVQPAGRDKVLREKRKNVHAFVRGMLHTSEGFGIRFPGSVPPSARVTYNPYKADHFQRKDTGTRVDAAAAVILDKPNGAPPVITAFAPRANVSAMEAEKLNAKHHITTERLRP